MKRPGFMVVWPFQLDGSRTRGQGRRLPLARGVKQPTVKEVWQASMTLGYSPEIQEKAALPRSFWEKTGYIIMKRFGARTVVLRAIAAEVLKNRQKESDLALPKKR